MTYFLYCHINKLNNKRYYGITCRNPIKRWGCDGYNYKSSPHFYSAIQKYGWDNFTHEIIYETDNKQEIEYLERFYIEKYKTFVSDFGYNIEMGGNYKGKHSSSTIEKIANSKLGKARDEDTKNKISQTLMGRFVGAKNSMSKPVICITTGVIYESQGIASRELHIDQSSISRCCSGKVLHAGSLNGQKLKWQYYKDYLEEGGLDDCKKT